MYVYITGLEIFGKFFGYPLTYRYSNSMRLTVADGETP